MNSRSLSTLIFEIETGQYKEKVLDLSAYTLNEDDVKKIISAIKTSIELNPNFSGFELNIGKQPGIKFSQMSQLRRVCMGTSSPIAKSKTEEKGFQNISNTNVKIDETKDTYGNISQRALFETELARDILNKMPPEPLKKVSIAIAEYIKNNPEIQEKMRNEQAGIMGYLWDHKEIPSMTIHKDVDPIVLYLKLLLEPESIPSIITLQKIFFENFFDSSLVNNQSNQNQNMQENINKPIGSLAKLAQNALQNKKTSSSLDKKLLDILQPESQFSEVNRGRKEIGREKSTTNFGITDLSHVPSWAQNYHKKPIPHAKDKFTRDEESNIVAFFEKNNIPFIAGPSGTAAYTLQGVLSLLPLDPQELKSYLNLLAASEVALGHHSFYEIMLVANNMKIYSFLEPGAEKNKATLTSQLDPKYLYDRFLSDDFKTSKEYNDLSLKYPEFLPNLTNKLKI